jgi:uncharacterized membrane protein (UPF0127 family)
LIDMSKRFEVAAACFAFVVFFMTAFASMPASAEEGVFEPLSITSQSGRHDFQVEVMNTDDEQQRGMMFRRSLADDKGMLFPFKTEQVATFWMENTYVSLDMIFINADGVVHRIEKRAEPLSTRMISSGAPVLAVLEVVAGTADRLGIRPGDKVSFSMFKAQ